LGHLAAGVELRRVDARAAERGDGVAVLVAVAGVPHDVFGEDGRLAFAERRVLDAPQVVELARPRRAALGRDGGDVTLAVGAEAEDELPVAAPGEPLGVEREAAAL